LLEIADTLHIALASFEKAQQSKEEPTVDSLTSQLKSLSEGVKLTERALMKTFASNQIKKVCGSVSVSVFFLSSSLMLSFVLSFSFFVCPSLPDRVSWQEDEPQFPPSFVPSGRCQPRA
jgi:hypothetical protein